MSHSLLPKIPLIGDSIDQLKESLFLFIKQKYVGESKFTLSKLGNFSNKTYKITLSIEEYRTEEKERQT